jgi:tol-pal system protein YbgF
MTPSQSRSMRTQVGEIRRQVDALHDRQAENGTLMRGAAAVRLDERSEPPPRAARQEVPPGETTGGPEQSATPPADPVRPVPEPRVDDRPAGESLYREGYRLYYRGEYEQSEKALRTFLQMEPDSPHADNAQYWIGECYYARGRYEEAIEQFHSVLRSYPDGNKRAHSLYKIALGHEKLGEREKMRLSLQSLIRSYPESDVADLARSRLEAT